MPDPRLDENRKSTLHWGARSRAVESDQKRAIYAIRESLSPDAQEAVAALITRNGMVTYRVEIGLEKGAKFRDSDNVQVWPKAMRDAIAKVFFGDWDGNWDLIETVQVRDPEGVGYTRFEFMI